MAITPFEAPPASDLAGDESHSSKKNMLLTCANAKIYSFSRTAAERQGTISRVLGDEPPAAKKIEKISASRARVFISRARFRMTRRRARAVARRGGPAKTFASIF